MVLGAVTFDETIVVNNIEKLKIAIITSRFNAEITSELTQRCVHQLKKQGIQANHVDTYDVPGALEIPYAAAVLMHQDKYDAIIALGCAIRGETYHFELVSNESAFGLAKLNLKGKTPIINGVLTVENEAQAIARLGKAEECAFAALEMIHFSKSLSKS